MKKLTIIWFSVLLSVAAYAGKLETDSHTRDVDGVATWFVSYRGTDAEVKNLVGLIASTPQVSAEGEKINVVDIGDGTYAAKYKFKFLVATSVLLEALGEEVLVNYIGSMHNGQPFPEEQSIGQFSLSLTNTASNDEPVEEPTEVEQPPVGDNSPAEIPAETGEPTPIFWFLDDNGEIYSVKGPKPGEEQGTSLTTPEKPASVQLNNIPSAPTASVSRNVALYTSKDLQEAREDAAREAAETAYQQGVAAVLSDPEAHGLNIDNGDYKPFVKGWCYVETLEWVFISEDLFPFMYSEKLNSWVLVQENKGVILYFIYQTQTWSTYEDMIDNKR